MPKNRKDPLCGMAKDKLIEAYRAKERELDWFRRLEHLRGRDCAPFACETIALGEYETDLEGETLTGQVFAPFAADGGVIRIVWRSANDRDSSVIIMGFEDFISECLRREPSVRSLGERILAERLAIEVNNRRPKAAA